MEGGCSEISWIKDLKKTDENKYEAICHTIREDGNYVEAGENDNLIVQKLDANPNSLGIFGFSFLDQNTDKIQGAEINGVEPTFENIAGQKYPISRPLYIYVKKAHATTIQGLKEYLAEFTSEKAWGEDGYLSEKGLIPMPDKEREEFRNAAKDLKTISCDILK
jgi:phosphate transport system substrate-binding protein